MEPTKKQWGKKNEGGRTKQRTVTFSSSTPSEDSTIRHVTYHVKPVRSVTCVTATDGSSTLDIQVSGGTSTVSGRTSVRPEHQRPTESPARAHKQGFSESYAGPSADPEGPVFGFGLQSSATPCSSRYVHSGEAAAMTPPRVKSETPKSRRPRGNASRRSYTPKRAFNAVSGGSNDAPKGDWPTHSITMAPIHGCSCSYCTKLRSNRVATPSMSGIVPLYQRNPAFQGKDMYRPAMLSSPGPFTRPPPPYPGQAYAMQNAENLLMPRHAQSGYNTGTYAWQAGYPYCPTPIPASPYPYGDDTAGPSTRVFEPFSSRQQSTYASRQLTEGGHSIQGQFNPTVSPPPYSYEAIDVQGRAGTAENLEQQAKLDGSFRKKGYMSQK